MTFDTEEALLTAMAAALPELVNSYVKPKGESILRQNIEANVYGVYTPTGYSYSRRGSLTKMVQSEITEPDEYSVDYSVTSAADAAPPAIGWQYKKGGLLAMLEKGDMGFWRKGFSRPSISPTQSQFNRGYLNSAIRQGIKSVF